jgi:hypothetical protein
MKVMIENIITEEKIIVDNLEKAIKKLSIRRENLQEDRNIVPFENGIFAVFRYAWYRITVYETLDNIMMNLKPLPIAMTRHWSGEWKPFVME